MNNISSIQSCYGCGVCATICPHTIISIELNSEGFYEPKIQEPDRCTECGLCLSVCSFVDDHLALKSDQVDYYSAWSRNEKIRRLCSSGGIGFEVGKYLIGQGYRACGVRYDGQKNRAAHFVANTVEEFVPSIGSKYIQSYTLDGFKKLNRKDNFLVTGTPCQIDSLRRYIRKLRVEDHFVLMDFFCHGVPSMLLWNQYSKEVEKQIGKSEYVSWRNKQTGWHDSWSMCIGDIDEKGTGKIRYISQWSKGDLFYKFFLGNFCLGRACYQNCKYKMSASSADIRIGDLWGTTYEHNQEGVSAVLALTEKGKEIVKGMTDYCAFEKLPESVVMEGQMRVAPPLPIVRRYVINELRKGRNLSEVFKTVSMYYAIIGLPKRVLNKIKKILLWEK